MRINKMNVVKGTSFGIFATYIITCLLIYIFQKKIMYLPSKDIRAIPRWNRIEDLNGELLGFENKKEGYKKTIIVFHGNTKNATFKTYFAKMFNKNARVIVAEYPGYGHNKRLKITKENILIHCNKLMNLIISEYGENENIVVVGESLGTGIASEMAAKYKINKLILITPYSSIVDVASSKFWFLPAKTLLKDNYDSILNLKEYIGNVLFVLSGKDKVIPNKFSKKLMESIVTEKEEIFVPDANHTDWWEKMTIEQKANFRGFYLK